MDTPNLSPRKGRLKPQQILCSGISIEIQQKLFIQLERFADI